MSRIFNPAIVLFSCRRFCLITSSASIWVVARSRISDSDKAEIRTSDSLNEFGLNPFKNATTRISSFGLVMQVQASQKRFKKSLKVSSDFCFTSKRSTTFRILTLLAANLSKNVQVNITKDVIEEWGKLMNHFRVFPESVPTKALQRIASFPPEISIWVLKAFRCASGSVLPKKGGIFETMNCYETASAMMEAERGYPSSGTTTSRRRPHSCLSHVCMRHKRSSLAC